MQSHVGLGRIAMRTRVIWLDLRVAQTHAWRLILHAAMPFRWMSDLPGHACHVALVHMRAGTAVTTSAVVIAPHTHAHPCVRRIVMHCFNRRAYKCLKNPVLHH